MTEVVRVHEIFVRAPLQASFEYVSDLARHPEWSSGRLVIEAATPGPVALGKEYISHGAFLIQEDRQNTVRVAHYEPPHRFGFVAKDPAVGDVSHIFTFREESQGTLIRRTMTLSLNPIVAVIFGFLIYPMTGSPAMEKSMALLKEKLEEKQQS